MNTVDINCDLGEGMNNEHLLLPYISRCNIACGGHAGDEKSIRSTIKMAIAHKVKIGAHPSYNDKLYFGRKVLEISNKELKESIEKQLSLFFLIAKEEGTQVDHIKPHGALYNQAIHDENIANIILEVLETLSLKVNLLVPEISVIAELAAKKKINVIYEAFADRNYEDDLSLVSRNRPDAVLKTASEVVHHLSMLIDGKVKTIHGNLKSIKASSFCIHSDTPGAETMLANIVNLLAEKSIKIAK